MDSKTAAYCVRLRTTETKRRREKFAAQLANDSELANEILTTVNSIVMNDDRNDLLRVFSRKSGAL